MSVRIWHLKGPRALLHPTTGACVLALITRPLDSRFKFGKAGLDSIVVNLAIATFLYVGTVRQTTIVGENRKARGQIALYILVKLNTSVGKRSSQWEYSGGGDSAIRLEHSICTDRRRQAIAFAFSFAGQFRSSHSNTSCIKKFTKILHYYLPFYIQILCKIIGWITKDGDTCSFIAGNFHKHLVAVVYTKQFNMTPTIPKTQRLNDLLTLLEQFLCSKVRTLIPY